MLAVRAAAPMEGGAAAAWALEWLAGLLAAPTWSDAASSLLRGLAERFGCQHARLGWCEGAPGAGCPVLAGWDAAAVLGRSPARELAQAALDEAVDQGLTVTWPPLGQAGRDHSSSPHPPSSPTPAPAPAPAPALTLASDLAPISLALQALLQGLGQGQAAVAICIPLASAHQPGTAVGAVCLVRRDDAGMLPGSPAPTALAPSPSTPLPLDVATLEHLLALAAPVLEMKREGERTLRRQAWLRLQARWRHLRAPAGRRMRRRLAVGALTLALATLLPVDERVGGSARLEGAEQRVLAAPTDGFLKAAHAWPGDHVKAGQVLADLAEQDLKLEHDKWASQLSQHENAYAAAMARSDREGRAEAAVALAKSQEAQAQLSLVGEALQRSQLSAPFDGIVIQGDLSQQIGAPVRQGDPLMTVASTRRYRVIVQVDERDIAQVRPGQRGVLSLSALPWDTLAIHVLRVTPLAQVVEAGNVFEVQAEIDAADTARALRSDIRPGLQGHAKLVVGRQPWLWGVLRPWVQRVRVALWAWWG